MNLELILTLKNIIVNRRNDLFDMINAKEDRLNEVNSFLIDVETNSQDMKLFSPFSTDELYDNKIDLYNHEKDELSNSIVSLREKYNEYGEYISLINDYIVSCESDNFLEVPSIEDEYSKEGLVSDLDLKSLIHQLNIISSFIKVDPNRAIDELKLCISRLNSI